jgi:hypothetical protein
VIEGGDGNDTLAGGNGADLLIGGRGDDMLIDGGGIGADTIEAGAGDDTVLDTGGGNDVINFGDGDDRGGLMGAGLATDSAILDGGDGNDEINGGAGRDVMRGGDGQDTIDGWGGGDFLTGGKGSDQFQIWQGESQFNNNALDFVLDWTGGTDTLFFGGADDDGLGAGTRTNYAEITATDGLDAFQQVNALIAAGVIDYVAVQLNGNVVVFADVGDDNGGADVAVLLSGRTLANITYTDIV